MASTIREIRLGTLCAFVAPVTDCSDGLPDGERERVRVLPESRRHAHATGRLLAHHALRTVGATSPSIGVGSHGEPLWPTGIVGSISHTQELALAAVAPKATRAGIGVDIERIDRAEPDIHPLLFTDREREIHRDRDLTLLFSAKEACYKLYRPIAGRYLDFLDVEIDHIDDRSGTLRVHPCRWQPMTDLFRAAEAHFLRYEGHWIVAIVLPRSAHWAIR